MPPAAEYQSLVNQVAERIALGMSTGIWLDVLPGERVLAESLNVSRKTLRKALDRLDRQGLIKTSHGLSRRIIAGPKSAPVPKVLVGLLSPEPLEQLRAHTLLWVGELRGLLFEEDIRILPFSGRRFFTRDPDESLALLVRHNPMACWILIRSTERMQRWFCDRSLPGVVAGSSDRRFPLPTVGIDYFSICRHAASAMIRRGHRRVAFLIQQSTLVGDHESENGFEEGLRRSAAPGLQPMIARHDGTVSGGWTALGRLFDQAEPPTALLVGRPDFYLTAVAFLAQRGLRVPDDVSLISRDDEGFLCYLKPEPARYVIQPLTFARLVSKFVLGFARNERPSPSTQLIEPRFTAGESLGRL